MSTFGLRLASVAACGAVLFVAERPASAYSYASAVSAGCHERITTAALRTIRTRLSTAPPIDPDSNERALIDDLPFSIEADMRDLAAASFLVGVRDNDLHGRGPTEIDSLAAVHGNPENQEEHCLRAPDDDETDGSVRALERCKGFIRGKIAEALDGLDDQGIPDPNRRVGIEVTLSFRGRVTASLPVFWVRMGQAVHTLQDGFSHTFRSPDRMRPRTVLNWIDYVNGNEVESRDGPVHRNGLDVCDNLDDLRTRNIGVATLASIDLLAAMLDPALGHDAKLAAVDATLVKYLNYEPGCTYANGWCNAPEREYEIAPSCGCSAIGARSGGALAAGVCAVGIALFMARRKRRCAALPLALVCLAAPSLAHAQPTLPAPATSSSAASSPAPPTSAPPAPPPPPDTTTSRTSGAQVATDEKKPPLAVPTQGEANAEKTEIEHQRFFGVYAAVSGSATNPALDGQFGLRFRLSKLVTLGLDGEVDRWYSEQTNRWRTGVFNAYATSIFHFPMRFERVNLRSTVNFGTSTMLIDLYGAPHGTTGVFFGIVPLGLEVKATSRVYVIWDALGLALPVPQLKGAPFSYPQYRSALGIELMF
jgi:hypothetical protein